MKKVFASVLPMAAALALCVSAGVGMAASKMTLTAHLKGSAEVAKPGPMHGTGTATVRAYANTNKMCYTLHVSGFKLPAIAAHIHAGRAGKEGPVVVPFPTFPGKTGNANGCVTVKSSLFKAITGHPSSYYVNVHSTSYPGGAVRGQLG